MIKLNSELEANLILLHLSVNFQQKKCKIKTVSVEIIECSIACCSALFLL